MNYKPVVILAMGLAAAPNSVIAQSKLDDNQLEKKGTVQRLLMNPEGDIDGFLLSDGTQVNFPPHMSSQLSAVVSPKDNVNVRGYRENAKVFKAEKITNLKTSKSVVEAEPPLPIDGPRDEAGGPPPPPRGSPRGPRPPVAPGKDPASREGLQELSAQGKIQAQIFGRRGEVNGVILSDNSIIRFGPRVSEDSSVKTNVGQNIKASGFGTQNSFGKAIEATAMSNN